MSASRERVRFTDPFGSVIRIVVRSLRTQKPWLLTALLLVLALLLDPSHAANPGSGTLTATSGPLTYTAGPFAAPNATAQAFGLPDCTAPMSCDDFTLTVNAASLAAIREVQVRIEWPVANADFDLYVLDQSGTTLVKSSASGNDPEAVLFDIPAAATTYIVRVATFNPLGQSFTGTISLVPFPPAPNPGAGIPPRYQAYAAPRGMGNTAGEPSLGVDWRMPPPGVTANGGRSFFTSGIQELRVGFDDCSSPAADLWEDVSSPFVIQSVLSDPIGFVDHVPGRVFQLDLIGGEGNSFAAYSDDGGASWTPMQGGGAPAGPDHETLGAGPYNNAALPPPPPHPTYQNAVYYCSQNIAGDAECSRSDDGGLTFGPGVPLFNVAQCTGGIHGHVKVAPDGTVYVPNSSCATGLGTAGIAVSTDNGLTWTDRTVPGSTGNADPSVGVGQNSVGRPAGQTTNTIYLSWVNGDGHPLVAVSHDRGLTWVGTADVGVPFGIKNSVFPAVVAGDDNRAAVGFLGTPTGGNSSDEATFTGIWHLYIATTYDGGQTWTTVDATPDDPVQVGSICLLGLSCGKDRNLLDFDDFTIDREGRGMFGFADGCLPPGCTTTTVDRDGPPYFTSRSAKASIARQSGGRRLLSAFDPAEPALPGAPKLLSATRLASGVDVTWLAPDDGGSPLTHYNVFRGTSSGGETLLATTSNAQKPEYLDTTANASTTYYYDVTATNAVGTGSSCGELSASGPIVTPRPADSCSGVDVVVDPSGDAVNPAASGAAAGSTDQVDITGVSFAVNPAHTTLTTTLRLKNLSQVPINGTTFSSYFVAWKSSDGKRYATQVDVDAANQTASWGEFDPNNNQLITTNSTTSTFTAGPDGTITVDVPMSGIGNPTIPISDPAGTTAVTDPFAIIIGGEGALGAGLVFLQPEDRAPDSGFGQRWAVCAAGPATYYSLNAPASANAGTAFNVTVTARDFSNNVADGYRGTVHFTSGDGLATLPANYTFTAADAGVHTFSVTLRTAGLQPLTATDTVSSSITASATIAVNTAPPPNTCISTPSQVVTDPAGDQTPGATEFDVRSVSVGEDYQYIGSPRLVFVLKVADLATVPANGIWRVRWNFGSPVATTYYVAMTTDTNSLITFDYGSQSGSLLTSLGALEAGTYATDGTITMTLAKSKVGNPAGGALLSAVNGLTQANVGGALFLGLDSTSSADYTVRPQAPTCTPVPPSTSSATYLKGGMTFSPSFTVRAPYIGQDVEPSLRADRFGNTYVAAIRGVPGGTDLWYFDLRPTIPGLGGAPIPNPNYDPRMRNPLYRGQPDSITGSQDAAVGGDGGGDVDMAVGFDEASPGNPPYLAYSSLALANVSTQRSTDRGATFLKNPLGSVTGGVPVDDRQWMEFFGSSQVYLLYRTFEPAVTQIQRSIDGGLTYGPARTAGAIGQVGGIDVDQNDGTVYISGSSGSVAVGIPPAPGLEPLTYTVHSVGGGGKAHLFFTVKVASDGTAYACYSDDVNVFIQYTRDKGNTWSAPIRVNDGPETKMSIFPWMETGPIPGTIGVVWYGTDQPTNDNPDNWNVFYALGTGANTATPTFRQVIAGDHVIHAANISESGLVIGGQSPNRNLADYFQIAFDPQGAAVIAFADDHNDFAGNTFVMRQIGGPSVSGGTVPAPIEGTALPPLAPFSTDGSQVTDFRRDVRDGGNSQLGGLVVLPVDDPLDILSIKYATETSGGGPLLTATMKVSDITVIPPSSNWRMNFAANAPNSQLSPWGDFTFGISDRADQFYVQASTDTTGAQTFVYGTATRNFDGSLTYTSRGSADSGAFDPAGLTITIKVALAKLNALLTAAGHPTLQSGSVLAGLRGQAFTNAQGNNVKLDSTRGGTQYAINLPPVAVNDSYSTAEDTTLVVPAPGVLANDTDDGPITAVLVSGPSHGTLTLHADGSFVYVPNADFNGGDGFTYKANDGTFDSNVATVSITVSPVNDRPTAANKTATTSEDTPVTITLSGSDIDSASLGFSIVTPPGHGTLGAVSPSSCTPSGSGSSCTATVTYTPAVNYVGSDGFTYKANDGQADSNVATVSITVTSSGTSESSGKVTGGGQISVPGGAASFGFDARRDTTGGPVKGQLEYQNHARSLNVHSTSITALAISGNTARFAGTCTKNGVSCTFTVTVQDNGEPGSNDTFTIEVSGEPAEGGRIASGNIQIHKP
jgi:VCBS repeat-containing protein